MPPPYRPLHSFRTSDGARCLIRNVHLQMCVGGRVRGWGAHEASTVHPPTHPGGLPPAPNAPGVSAGTAFPPCWSSDHAPSSTPPLHPAPLTSCPWSIRRHSVPPMLMTSSSGWGLITRTRLGKTERVGWGLGKGPSSRQFVGQGGRAPGGMQCKSGQHLQGACFWAGGRKQQRQQATGPVLCSTAAAAESATALGNRRQALLA